MPNKRIDLHMHTTHSDGTLTPNELVSLARSENLSCVALTNHDTINGISEAQTAGHSHGVEVIAGVEISVVFDPGTMHILGYFLDIQNHGLQSGLEGIQRDRRERNPKIIEQLRSLGVEISLDEVARASGGGQIGRPHFARVLVEKKYAKDNQEAFKRYLSKGAPAYVDKRRITSREAIQMIREAGGVASLAHPKQLRLERGEAFENVIAQLMEEGLSGLEVYSSCQSPGEAAYYMEVAKRFGLVPTGGSDFHGANKPTIQLGWLGDGVDLYYDTIEALRNRIER